MSTHRIQHLGDGWDLVGRTIKLPTPADDPDAPDVIIRVAEHVAPTDPPKPEGHLIAGAVIGKNGGTISERSEMMLPDGLPIEFLDDIADSEQS